MNKNHLRYYLLVFLAFVKVCNAQVNDSVYKHQQTLNAKSNIILNLSVIPVSEIKPLLKSKKKYAVRFSNIKEVDSSFIALYRKHVDSLIIISKNEDNNFSTYDLYTTYIKPSDLETLNLINTKAFESTFFRYYKEDKFSSIKLGRDVKLTDSIFLKVWRQSGRLPNFIEPNRISLLKADSVVNRFNTLRRVFGVVKTEEGELINDVRFKGYEESVVNGYFSFPVLKGEPLPVLMPYKAGYHFSPDIIYTTPENYQNSKRFNAFQLDLGYELSDHYTFNPKFKNKVKKNDKELLINNIEIKEDSIFGKVGYFKSRSYIDTGIESKNSLQKSFTITAWVKPTLLGFNNSILGKGNNFVVKLRYGSLTFTMAGIKDYISNASTIPSNKWSHIAISHSEIDNKLFFYVNGQLTDEVKLISKYLVSDYNILIGSNIWEEFFDGYIADIKIWERELNGNEISILFEKKEENSLRSGQIIGVIVFVILLVILFVLLKKQKPKKEETLLYKEQNKFIQEKTFISDLPKDDNIESVLCFGKLRILNKRGDNIAENLSPLLKKIFVIVFLYSHQGNKKGISTKQLTEFLWPGMSSQKAKNTRGTNINNLRSILNSSRGVNLIFKDKSWFVELTEDCFCDYLVIQQYLYVFSNGDYSIKELEQELPRFLELLKGGRLFSSSSEPWLDPFIEKFSNQIIEQCLEFTEIFDVEKHSELMLLLTEVICLYDDLNEKAHKLKLQALIQQGKLSLAYKAYDNFIKLYYKIYKEIYSISFEEMTSKQN